MMVVSVPAGKESVDWHSAEVQYSMAFFKVEFVIDKSHHLTS